MNNTIILSVFFVLISCGKVAKKEKYLPGTKIGEEFLVQPTDLEGNSPFAVCMALKDKRDYFKKRDSLWFDFEVTVNNCVGDHFRNITREKMDISGEKMEFNSRVEGFINEIESDVSGFFGKICPQVLRGEIVKNIKEVEDGKKIYFIFGKDSNTTIDVSIYTVLRDSRDEKKYFTVEGQKFLINTTQLIIGEDSDRGLVESHSYQFRCNSGEMYLGSQTVIH
jgi:hypothetical protein